MRPATLTFRPRILYLTEDPELLRRQLDGEQLAFDPARPLINNISTDEITPGWVCYYYDETLARYCLVGLRGGVDPARRHQERRLRRHRQRPLEGLRQLARDGAVLRARGGHPARHRRRASRRSTARTARTSASSRRPTSALLERIARGEEIPISEFTRGLDPISADIVEYGGLFAYNKARLAGEVAAAAHRHAAAPDDALREDHRRARDRRREDGQPRRPRGASRATRCSCAPTCASRTST